MRLIDGLPIANAAKPLRLKITPADIRKGAPLNPYACAIALAACRQLARVDAAKVHLGVVYLRVRGEWFRYKTTQAVAREITAYDRGGKFYPGEYDLLPVSTVSLIRRAYRGATASSSRRRSVTKRRAPHRTEGVRASAYSNEPPAEPRKGSRHA